MSRIVVEKVSKSYRSPRGEVAVLAETSLTIEAGTFATLLGANGCGKTTLLGIIAGTVAADRGEVSFGQDREELRVGFAWQDYRASLLPWYDVADNIALPLRIRGVPPAERRRRAESLLASTSRTIKARQRCYQLSGGQQQLVSVLRSVVLEPQVLLLDEPFSALDLQTRWEMAAHVERLWRQHPTTALLVSHDIDEAILLADEILLMSRTGGRIVRKIVNRLPRPRALRMLTAGEHVRCRAEAIEFLLDDSRLESRPDPDAPTPET